MDWTRGLIHLLTTLNSTLGDYMHLYLEPFHLPSYVTGGDFSVSSYELQARGVHWLCIENSSEQPP